MFCLQQQSISKLLQCGKFIFYILDFGLDNPLATKCPSWSDYRGQSGSTAYLRSALYWDITQRIVVVPYRSFGTSC